MTSFCQAIDTRDSAQDGTFVYAVKTTGVFCRPADARHPEAACRYIESHAEGFPLAKLARRMGYTPRAYAEPRRVTALKQNLRDDQPVTDAIYQASFSSPSHVYETADQHCGMTAATYRKHGQGMRISFTIAPSATLGFLPVAQTERGVCSLAFGNTESALITALHAGLPEADIARSESHHVNTVLAHLAGTERHLRLPLDIEATVFVALAIPCHRLVRQGGALSGYRWGIERKSALLRKEGE
jgi:AraC family transcriptional regulator of adaptative response/methylated-DNA-[protein]-cysteine methyltransferase